MMNTASSVNSCHQSHGVAMAGDSTPAPGPQVWWAEKGLALECRSIRQVQANVTYRNVKCMHYKADRVHYLVWVQRICRFFDTGTGWVTDLFSTGLLLSRRAKDEHRASRQVMALHCLTRRSQMKCAASLSASAHRHGEVLKHWPCSGPFWICYGSPFPWTVTTSNRPLLMVSYTVWWSLCRRL